ncbi:uncharacterized protein LOC123921416 isoform X2 [Trifolium pratense]|uniref:uncharacterized protein LOC123921416 isoform X2 n=1 Tax=Trifolium pratense TaxID=57577 RepID=UPI001E692A0F|nr:uncharacterized protein LOC123921416 isoform X2 [Trifolium pratense]
MLCLCMWLQVFLYNNSKWWLNFVGMRSYQMQVDLLLEVLNIVSGFGPTSGSALTSHMNVDKCRLLNLYLLLIQEVDLVKDDIKIIDIPVHLVKRFLLLINLRINKGVCEMYKCAWIEAVFWKKTCWFTSKEAFHAFTILSTTCLLERGKMKGGYKGR